MASGKTDTFENAIIDHFLRNQASSGPYSAYLALYSTAPGESTSGTELSGNNYSRQAIGFGAPSAGSASNAGTVTFSASGGAWLQIVGHGICSASTAGIILYYEDSVSGPTLSDGDSYQFDAGDITVQET